MEAEVKTTQGTIVSAENPEITAPADWQPVIIGILCNWCSYAGSDLTGTSRIQYPPNIRIIRVPCSSRVDPWFIIKSLQATADGVLISGCHPGDCHFIKGNYFTRRKMAALKEMFKAFSMPNNVKLFWVSAAEARRFVEKVTGMYNEIKEAKI